MAYNSHTPFKKKQQYKKAVQYQVQTGTRTISVILLLPEISFWGQKCMQCDWGWPRGGLKITEPEVHSEDRSGFWRVCIMSIINILIYECVTKWALT